jgi:putative isomerase
MEFVDESGRFLSLLDCPFGRRGSYFAIYAGHSEHFGRAHAYLATCHGTATVTGKTRLFSLYPLYGGERVPYAVIMHPAELILRTLYGDVRICIAERNLILFQADHGLGLRFAATTEELDRGTKPRGKTAWQTEFRHVCATVIHTITGSIAADAPWDWERLRCHNTKIDLLPDAAGRMQGSLEEFLHAGLVRDAYPTYEEGLAAVTADWEGFLANIPALPGKYDAVRAKAAWHLWSSLVGPSGMIRREMLFMSRNSPTSQWQQTFQAVALANNTQPGWDQMLNSFEYQAETGQLPDYYDDCRGAFATIRPPVHGWALKLMKRLGYYWNLPPESIADFYPRLAAWANFFGQYRNDSVDGLPHYDFSEESGMEDGSTFRDYCYMVTPDLPAYLVLLFEELGDMSEGLGMDPSVKTCWYDRAADMQARLIEKLWNGERFVSHTLDGREIDKDYGILGYMPVLLGKRLPAPILAKLVADLKIEGYVLSDVGFDKEKVCARDLSDIMQGDVRGFIYPTFNIMLIDALYNCGEQEFARTVARRYCDAMLEGGFGGYLNTFTGARQGGRQWITWTTGSYLLIAGYTGEPV